MAVVVEDVENGGYSGVARIGAKGARNQESNFYWISNHSESNVRVCAALKLPEK